MLRRDFGFLSHNGGGSGELLQYKSTSVRMVGNQGAWEI